MALTSKDRKKIAKPRLSAADHLVHELNLYQLQLSQQQKSTQASDTHVLPVDSHHIAEQYHCVPAGFFTQDKNGLLVEVSAAGTKVLGIDKQGLVHRMKMARADRATTIHELASILVHEINQPLAAITNYLHGCIRRLESGQYQTEDIVHALKQAVKQSQRTSEITQNVKKYSQRVNYHFESACLNSLVKDALMFVELDTTFTAEFTPALNNPHVMLDKVHLQQAICHLIRHAAASLHHATANHTIAITVNETSKQCVMFGISVQGTPLPAEAIAQLLRPEYASGINEVMLDIAVSRRIIEAHGGTLHIYHDEQRGNCYQFTLCSQMLSASPLF